MLDVKSLESQWKTKDSSKEGGAKLDEDKEYIEVKSTESVETDRKNCMNKYRGVRKTKNGIRIHGVLAIFGRQKLTYRDTDTKRKKRIA